MPYGHFTKKEHEIHLSLSNSIKLRTWYGLKKLREPTFHLESATWLVSSQLCHDLGASRYARSRSHILWVSFYWSVWYEIGFSHYTTCDECGHALPAVYLCTWTDACSSFNFPDSLYTAERGLGMFVQMIQQRYIALQSYSSDASTSMGRSFLYGFYMYSSLLLSRATSLLKIYSVVLELFVSFVDWWNFRKVLSGDAEDIYLFFSKHFQNTGWKLQSYCA